MCRSIGRILLYKGAANEVSTALAIGDVLQDSEMTVALMHV